MTATFEFTLTYTDGTTRTIAKDSMAAANRSRAALMRNPRVDDATRPAERSGTRMVRHALTGEMVEEDVNTPFHCSVASESYFCS